MSASPLLRAMAAAVLCAGLLIAGPARADYDQGVAARAAGHYRVAILTLDAALEAGDARAALVLGEMYEEGQGVTADHARACAYDRQAADAGIAEGEYRAGQCDVAGDPAKALALFQSAADQGYTAALCASGELYLAGKGVAADPQQGLARCLAGAKAGDARAMATVADLYWKGEGTAADPQQAVTWWQKAAAAGSVKAAWTLGVLYKTGNGIPADPGKANTYLRMAFEHGALHAAALLADLLVPLARRQDGSINQRVGTAALFWAGLAAHVDDDPGLRARSAALYHALAAEAPSLVPHAQTMLEAWLGAHRSLDQAP